MIAWIDQHKVLTALIALLSYLLVAWVTWRVFGPTPPDIPGGTAAALATVYGLPALAVGLLKWRGEFLSRKEKPDAADQN